MKALRILLLLASALAFTGCATTEVMGGKEVTVTHGESGWSGSVKFGK